jgi:uncharacterized protein YjbI with pentapeptide repeats
MTLTPDWPTCVHGDGCEGVRWGQGEVCLAHLDEPALNAALAALRSGSDIDLRGTPLTQDLLDRVLHALTPDGENTVPNIGTARFRGAQFSGDAGFDGVQFTGDAGFDGVQFSGNARFNWAQFSGDAGFRGAQFSGVQFSGAQFSGDAEFSGAQFSGNAWFDRTQFSVYAGFGGAQFSGDAWFDGAQFRGNAWFDGVRFEGFWVGPLVCRGALLARRVVVARGVRLQVAARQVVLAGARFAEPSVFSVRYGAVDLADVAAGAPVTVAWHAAPFTHVNGMLMEDQGLDGDARAAVVSLAGVDAANIVLSDVDLSSCVFSGAHHLDQIRLEARCLFASAPRGRHWGRALVPVRRWTRRKVLAEEAAWHAAPERRPTLARAGWQTPARPDGQAVPAAKPAQLAVLYRQLRKALEDGKDTPGAADFYYGEMEARRHDTDSTPRGERALLHAYWLLSGYALRASRALGFLAAAAAITFLRLLTLGLPDNQLDPQITGTISAPGGHAVLTQSTPDPQLTLRLAQRFTADRADQASLVVVNSVIFRSTGTTLTGPGTWIEIISRIGEPVLLGFAAVAARGRVQR